MTQNKERIEYVANILRTLADEIESEQVELLQFERRAYLAESPDETDSALKVEATGLRRLELMTKHPSREKTP